MRWEEVNIPKSINISIFITIVISFLVGHYFVPLTEWINLIRESPILVLLLPLLVLVYIVSHEFIHGYLMKYYSDIKSEYGFAGPFIYAKSEAVFSKYAYAIITLAPMIILGAISATLIFSIPGRVVWFFIFIWAVNLFASRGDLQAITVLKKLPSTYSIKDDGDSITIYNQIN